VEKAVSMKGLPEMPIKNIELDNIIIRQSGEISEIDNVKNISYVNVKY
jgi:hypothetical protein